MHSGRGCLIALLLVAGVGSLRGAGHEARDWRDVLALPPARLNAQNAFVRWLAAVSTMPELTSLDEAILAQVPNEPPGDDTLAQLRKLTQRCAPALAAFTVQPGEYAQLPSGYRMGQGVPGPEVWRSLAQLKALHVRLAWWAGLRASAAAATVDLIRAGVTATRDATDLHAWITWMQVAATGFDSALWIARQVDVTDDELAPLARALAAESTWPDGAVNALRGEFAGGFANALDHLPDTRDITTMLDALADFGLPRPAAGAAGKLGEATKPLLDRDATLALYGEPTATFIQTITRNPVWQYGVFQADFDRRSDAWIAELGVWGELALSRRSAEYPADKLGAIKAVLNQVENPIGKLFVAYAATNFDGVAFEGLRVEAHRRCVRLLIEWRRRILRSADLPADVASWMAAGFDASAIEDPFTGRPLSFDPDKLKVWSVGVDGIDNHGTGDPQAKQDGTDFWWSLQTP